MKKMVMYLMVAVLAVGGLTGCKDKKTTATDKDAAQKVEQKAVDSTSSEQQTENK